VNKRACAFQNFSKFLQHVYAYILRPFERFVLIRDFDIAILVIMRYYYLVVVIELQYYSILYCIILY